MTRASLVALLPRTPTLAPEVRTRFQKVSEGLRLKTHELASGASVAVCGPAAVARSSALVGDVYSSGGKPMADLGALCRSSDGCHALSDDGFWGDFLTLGYETHTAMHRLTRSPFGSLSCVWIDEGTHVIAATTVTLLEAYAAKPLHASREQLATYLLSPQMRNGATCLQGVSELPPGFTLETGCRRPPVMNPSWSPWCHACSPSPIADFSEASQIVREAIDRAVAARCSQLHNPVLLLSGGLDSSVLAASLARAGCSYAALTMVTQHRSGDERHYARAVAQATGAPLSERLRAPTDLDWDDPTPRRQVRPSALLFRQPTLRAAHRLAQETGGNAILDGGGGDDLFCSLSSVAPLLDRLAVEGLRTGAMQTSREIALRADVDVAAVAAKALRRIFSRRVAFRWPFVADFLTPDALAHVDAAVRHPWLKAPPGALPGQAAHVALLLDALALAEDDSLDPVMRTLSPLVAQPVAEAVLRVRSWLWFARGRNRAVVRHAFAGRLPAPVLQRTGKGTPGGFVAELVRHHRTRIRSMLLDGVLAEQGIVDQAAVEAALGQHANLRDDHSGRLLTLVDAERFARLWR